MAERRLGRKKTEHKPEQNTCNAQPFLMMYAQAIERTKDNDKSELHDLTVTVPQKSNKDLVITAPLS